MKKIILVMFIFLTAFFFSSQNINATSFDVNISDGGYSVSLPTDYETDVFNYFEEQKNNTEFYNMLKLYGSDIYSYLFSIHPDNRVFSDIGNVTLSLFNIEEIQDFCSFRNRSDSVCARIPENATNFILVSYTGSDVSHFIGSIDNSLYFNLAQVPSPNYAGQYVGTSFLFFNGGTYLSPYTSVSRPQLGTGYVSSDYGFVSSFLASYRFSYNWIRQGWWIFGSNTYYGTDFSYFLSKVYYSTTDLNLSSINDITINVGKALFDDVGSDINNLSSSYYLDYLKKNSLISSSTPLKSLLSIMNDKPNVTIPVDYNSQYFGLTNEVSLFPVTSCSLNDLALYVTSNDTKSFNLYLHEITSDDQLSYQSSCYNTYSIKKDNIIKINPLSNCSVPITIGSSVTDTSLTPTNFINYSYRLQAFDNKAEYIVHYNPDCYVQSYNYESVTFVNPVTGNNITYDDSYSNWSNPDSVNIGNSIPLNSNPEDYDIDVSNWFTTAWNGAKSFIMAGVEIVSLSTLFFDSLPSEVSAIILCVFIISSLIILIKILNAIGLDFLHK